MKNVVLSVVLSAFIFTAVPVHAQVTVPSDREGLIALIQILLKRIEEMQAPKTTGNTAQQARLDAAKRQQEKNKADKQKSIEEYAVKAKADAQKRIKVVEEEIVYLDTLVTTNGNLPCQVSSTRVQDRYSSYNTYTYTGINKKTFSDKSNDNSGAAAACATENTNYLANLKVEQLRLQRIINGN